MALKKEYMRYRLRQSDFELLRCIGRFKNVEVVDLNEVEMPFVRQEATTDVQKMFFVNEFEEYSLYWEYEGVIYCYFDENGDRIIWDLATVSDVIIDDINDFTEATKEEILGGVGSELY